MIGWHPKGGGGSVSPPEVDPTPVCWPAGNVFVFGKFFGEGGGDRALQPGGRGEGLSTAHWSNLRRRIRLIAMKSGSSPPFLRPLSSDIESFFALAMIHQETAFRPS